MRLKCALTVSKRLAVNQLHTILLAFFRSFLPQYRRPRGGLASAPTPACGCAARFPTPANAIAIGYPAVVGACPTWRRGNRFILDGGVIRPGQQVPQYFCPVKNDDRSTLGRNGCTPFLRAKFAFAALSRLNSCRACGGCT